MDGERGTLTVRLGKGKKDRVVPIGERDRTHPGAKLEPQTRRGWAGRSKR